MSDITVQQAIDVLAQHAAQTRNPGILAAIKHVEAGLDGTGNRRPADRSDSPGMQAAHRHMHPDLQEAKKSQGFAAAVRDRAAKGGAQPKENDQQ